MVDLQVQLGLGQWGLGFFLYIPEANLISADSSLIPCEGQVTIPVHMITNSINLFLVFGFILQLYWDRYWTTATDEQATDSSRFLIQISLETERYFDELRQFIIFGASAPSYLAFKALSPSSYRSQFWESSLVRFAAIFTGMRLVG